MNKNKEKNTILQWVPADAIGVSHKRRRPAYIGGASIIMLRLL
jgi:hypothetical protein